MAERQETSVMVSIQEILRDAQNREEQEKVEAEHRARAEEQRRLDEARRRQEEEEARIRAEEEDRQRRAFEEQRRQAELQAMQEAHVQRARSEAEAQARLAEMAARQEHERQLHALSQDKHKKRLTFILVGLGAVLFIGAIGGGVLYNNVHQKALMAEAQVRAMQDEKDKAEAEQARLKAQLENTKDPEQIAQLQAQLAEQGIDLFVDHRVFEIPWLDHQVQAGFPASGDRARLKFAQVVARPFTEQPDQEGAVAREAPGIEVRPVIQLLDGVEDSRFRIGPDARLVVDDPGDGLGRDFGQVGYFLNRDGCRTEIDDQWEPSSALGLV